MSILLNMKVIISWLPLSIVCHLKKIGFISLKYCNSSYGILHYIQSNNIIPKIYTLDFKKLFLGFDLYSDYQKPYMEC